jgi:hypothetical protein
MQVQGAIERIARSVLAQNDDESDQATRPLVLGPQRAAASPTAPTTRLPSGMAMAATVGNEPTRPFRAHAEFRQPPPAPPRR